jgi:hypothetical protein
VDDEVLLVAHDGLATPVEGAVHEEIAVDDTKLEEENQCGQTPF